MAAHELKECPRCAEHFECKPGNIGECQCFGLQFSEGEKAFIGSAGSDCLCRGCLLALKQAYQYRETRVRLEQLQSIGRLR